MASRYQGLPSSWLKSSVGYSFISVHFAFEVSSVSHDSSGHFADAQYLPLEKQVKEGTLLLKYPGLQGTVT